MLRCLQYPIGALNTVWDCTKEWRTPGVTMRLCGRAWLRTCVPPARRPLDMHGCPGHVRLHSFAYACSSKRTFATGSESSLTGDALAFWRGAGQEARAQLGDARHAPDCVVDSVFGGALASAGVESVRSAGSRYAPASVKIADTDERAQSTRFARFARYQPLEEVFPAMRALLLSADVAVARSRDATASASERVAADALATRLCARAEHMYAVLSASRTAELLRMPHAGIQNAFLHHYLVRGSAAEFRTWRARILARAECTPDAMTFAIIAKDAISAGAPGAVDDILRMMAVDGVAVEDVLALGYLGGEEVSVLERASGAVPRPEASGEELCDIPLLDDAPVQTPRPAAQRTPEGVHLPPVSAVDSKSGGMSYLDIALGPITAAAGDVSAPSDDAPIVKAAFVPTDASDGGRPGPRSDDEHAPQPPPGWSWPRLYRMQEALERQCLAAAGQQARSAREDARRVSGGTAGASKCMVTRRLFTEWHTALSAVLSAELSAGGSLAGGASAGESKSAPGSGASGPPPEVAAVLSAPDAERLAALALHELLRPEAYDPVTRMVPLVRVAVAVGRAAESEVLASQLSSASFLRTGGLSPATAARLLRSRSSRAEAARRAREHASRERDALLAAWLPAWPARLCASVGVYLVRSAISACTYSLRDLLSLSRAPSSPLDPPAAVCDSTSRASDEPLNRASHVPLGRTSDELLNRTSADLLNRTSDEPMDRARRAFEHRVIPRRGKSVGVVVVRDRAMFEMLASEAVALPIDPWALPMVHPPRLWHSVRDGGYLTRRVPCVRVRDADRVQAAMVEAADRAGRMRTVYHGLSVLGMTAWAVNAPVLRVALALWNRGVDVSADSLDAIPGHALAAARADWARAAAPVPAEAPSAEDVFSRGVTVGGGSMGAENAYKGANDPRGKNEGQAKHGGADEGGTVYRRREEFATHEAFVAHVAAACAARQRAAEAHSARCSTNYVLAVARQYAAAGLPFYLPHSVDFRGRAYPIPPHLSHVGGDLCRGLLRFAHGRALGREGLFWLKVQAANASGCDKAPLAARVAFADAHAAEMAAAADDPLGPAGAWWRTAGREDPWQCLAACAELTAALRSPDPSAYVSTLPVQQDGSCNGLQHYAALGRDVDGARQVNVIPPLAVPLFPLDAAKDDSKLEVSPSATIAAKDDDPKLEIAPSATNAKDDLKLEIAPSATNAKDDGKLKVSLSKTYAMDDPGPQDVYAAVARLVNARIDRDAALYEEVCRAPSAAPGSGRDDPKGERLRIAHRLRGIVGRKTVKQSVMTTVYGVTRFGARRQVETRLREDPAVAALALPPADMRLAATYIADAVFASLGAIFERAGHIQRWLARVAEEVGRAVPPEVAARHGDAAARRILVREGVSGFSDDAAAPTDGPPTGAALAPSVQRLSTSRAWRAAYAGDPTSRYPQTLLAWRTPIGFEACQPYVSAGTLTLRTQLQQLSLRSAGPHDAVDARKQTTAFPPNYVHSLDAAHMFLTAIECHRRGLVFASVHDCFWTHAASVPEMSAVLREQFVALHSAPLLADLRTDLVARYGRYRVPVLASRTRADKCAPSDADRASGPDSEDDISESLSPLDEASAEPVADAKKRVLAQQPDPDAPPHDLRRLSIASWRPISLPAPPVPSDGAFDISLVLGSRYFFS